MRQYSLLDRLLIAVDEGRLLLHGGAAAARTPPDTKERSSLSDAERKLSASLMRVNHAGEVAAQGLYQGQAVTARHPATVARMHDLAQQERQHLQWCAERLHALHSRPGLLTPLWYGGSVGIGCLAGLMGDRWSFGFIEETENQVTEHLNSHLQRVPSRDKKTINIIERIKADEAEHAQAAAAAGAEELPLPAKKLMRCAARIMTTTAYYF